MVRAAFRLVSEVRQFAEGLERFDPTRDVHAPEVGSGQMLGSKTRTAIVHQVGNAASARRTAVDRQVGSIIVASRSCERASQLVDARTQLDDLRL